MYISRITVAEIEYGYKVFLGADPNRRQMILDALKAFGKFREIDKHTTAPYSDIRAALFRQFAPREKKGKITRKRPEELIDNTTARELKVQENDIWIAAIAVQHNMILVTEDRMTHIFQVEPRLRYQFWRKRNPT